MALAAGYVAAVVLTAWMANPLEMWHLALVAAMPGGVMFVAGVRRVIGSGATWILALFFLVIFPLMMTTTLGLVMALVTHLLAQQIDAWR